LKESKKKWSQAVSIRVFYRDDINISSSALTKKFTAAVMKQSKVIPSITGIPVSALGSNSDVLIACTVHIV
jgi:hypothetical protein